MTTNDRNGQRTKAERRPLRPGAESVWVTFPGGLAGRLMKMPASDRWYVSFRLNGQERRESTRTADFKVARRALKAKLEHLAAVRRGHETFVSNRTRRLTVAEATAALEQDLRLRRMKALRQTQGHLRMLNAALGAHRVVALTPEEIDKQIERWRAVGNADGTINRRLQLLGQALKFAHQRKLIPAAPKIRKLRESNVRQGFFEKPELDAILKHIRDDAVRDLIEFLYRTGWRKGEATTLAWDDMDVPGGIIRLRGAHSKNGRARFVALDPELKALIERREHARKTTAADETVTLSPLVFHRKGRPIAEFRKLWRNACVGAGLFRVVQDDDGTERKEPTKLVHDLRRSAVRDMLRAGVHERVAMAISGHRTRSIFDRYNITSEDDVRSAVARTAAYRATLPATSAAEH